MTKMQREWLTKIAERPIWYQKIPDSVRKACRKNGWTTTTVSGMQLCHTITDKGRAALAEAEGRCKP